jgi:hypothetical protein
MKPNYLKISAFLLGALYIVGMLYFLYGCSASYHFGKFLNKGGKIETKTDTVQVQKTIKINGKDSIIFVQMPFKCPEVQIPPTRQEIRYKYRIQRDSIETVRYVTKWKTKEVVKLAKAKERNPFNWFLIGLAIGIFTPILIRLIVKRL